MRHVVRNAEIETINQEEIEAFYEVLSMCFFKKPSQKNKFWSAVLAAGQCTRLEEMKLENFETAYVLARKILAKEGRKVLMSLVKRGATNE